MVVWDLGCEVGNVNKTMCFSVFKILSFSGSHVSYLLTSFINLLLFSRVV